MGPRVSALVRVPYHPVTEAGETELIAGVASMLVTTAVLFGALRVLLSFGPPPPGAAAVLFGSVALLVSAAFDEDVEGVVAALMAGVVVDVGLRLTRHRRARLEASASGVSAGALWLAYFGALRAGAGVAWSPEIWLGASVLCVVAAVVLAGAPDRPAGLRGEHAPGV